MGSGWGRASALSLLPGIMPMRAFMATPFCCQAAAGAVAPSTAPCALPLCPAERLLRLRGQQSLERSACSQPWGARPGPTLRCAPAGRRRATSLRGPHDCRAARGAGGALGAPTCCLGPALTMAGCEGDQGGVQPGPSCASRSGVASGRPLQAAGSVRACALPQPAPRCSRSSPCSPPAGPWV